MKLTIFKYSAIYIDYMGGKGIILKKGECVSIMKGIPDKSVDMIFADPPYNLSGKNHITCRIAGSR